MTKVLFLGFITTVLMIGGCAQKGMSFNGMICPAGKTEENIKADFQECRYYDLEAATKASLAPMSIECQKCLENKGYRVEQ